MTESSLSASGGVHMNIAWVGAPRAWLDKRSVWVGGLGGALGGLCCVAGAVALATGAGVLSSLTTWQDRFGPYFIAASVLLMIAWLTRQANSFGWSRDGLRRAGQVVGRQALVMGVIYGATLGLTFAIIGLAEAV
jgi:hypothetical protein